MHFFSISCLADALTQWCSETKWRPGRNPSAAPVSSQLFFLTRRPFFSHYTFCGNLFLFTYFGPVKTPVWRLPSPERPPPPRYATALTCGRIKLKNNFRTLLCFF